MIDIVHVSLIIYRHQVRHYPIVPSYPLAPIAVGYSKEARSCAKRSLVPPL